MVVRTEKIDVLTLEDFVTKNNGFFISPLSDFQQAYFRMSFPNQRKFHAIIYVEKGGGNFAIDQSVLRVGELEVININPNSVCRFDIDRNAQGWMICFTDSFFSKRYNDNVLYNFAFLKSNTTFSELNQEMDIPRLRLMLDDMYRKYQRPGLESLTVLRSYLNIVLDLLGRNSGQQLISTYNSDKEQKVRQFEQLLSLYYKTERFPSFYAEKLSISTNYLSRICREMRNCTAGDMIRNRVLIEAERLLYHTFNTVSEISYMLGFESCSYFITFFKKKYGQSPEEFRKANL